MSKWTTLATWDDVPHLTKEAKAELLLSIPPEQRDARARGIPSLGSGLIYPVDETSIRIKDIANIPPHWKRVYAFDTGWNWNAAVWGAWDTDTDTVYIYSVYKRDKAEPAINASAIISRGAWIPGVADAADVNRIDGRQYIQIYKDLGLDIELPDKSVEAGIQAVWSRLSTGRLRVFESCVEWFDEYRIYMRDSVGKIVKGPEHRVDVMDCTRYLVHSGLRRAKVPAETKQKLYNFNAAGPLSWMG